MNVFVALALVTELCFGLAVWFSRDMLRAIAARLLVRAGVLEGTKKLHYDQVKYWNEFLGVKKGNYQLDSLEGIKYT